MAEAARQQPDKGDPLVAITNAARAAMEQRKRAVNGVRAGKGRQVSAELITLARWKQPLDAAVPGATKELLGELAQSAGLENDAYGVDTLEAQAIQEASGYVARPLDGWTADENSRAYKAVRGRMRKLQMSAGQVEAVQDNNVDPVAGVIKKRLIRKPGRRLNTSGGREELKLARKFGVVREDQTGSVNKLMTGTVVEGLGAALIDPPPFQVFGQSYNVEAVLNDLARAKKAELIGDEQEAEARNLIKERLVAELRPINAAGAYRIKDAEKRLSAAEAKGLLGEADAGFIQDQLRPGFDKYFVDWHTKHPNPTARQLRNLEKARAAIMGSRLFKGDEADTDGVEYLKARKQDAESRAAEAEATAAREREAADAAAQEARAAAERKAAEDRAAAETAAAEKEAQRAARRKPRKADAAPADGGEAGGAPAPDAAPVPRRGRPALGIGLPFGGGRRRGRVEANGGDKGGEAAAALAAGVGAGAALEAGADSAFSNGAGIDALTRDAVAPGSVEIALDAERGADTPPAETLPPAALEVLGGGDSGLTPSPARAQEIVAAEERLPGAAVDAGAALLGEAGEIVTDAVTGAADAAGQVIENAGDALGLGGAVREGGEPVDGGVGEASERRSGDTDDAQS